MSALATTSFNLPRSQTASRQVGDRIFLGLIAFVACLQTIVFMEPAPFDLGIICLFLMALWFGRLSFAGMSPFPWICLIGFATMNIVSMYDPFDPTRALFYLGVTLYLILSWVFFVGLIGFYGSRASSLLIRCYVIAGLFSATLGILAYFHLTPASLYDRLTLWGRSRALFKDCNVYGPYLIPMAMFAATNLLGGARKFITWISYLVVFGVSTAAVLLSFSRAAWIAYGVALAVLCGLMLLVTGSFRASLRKAGLMLAVLSVAGVLFAALLHVPSIDHMMSQRVNSGGFQRYDQVRFATQRKALQSSIDRPLGIGPGQAEMEFMLATHSAYFRVLSENGLLALLCFISFLVMTLVRSLRLMMSTTDDFSRSLYMVVAACIVGHFVNSGVIDTVHWRHIWFLCALPWAPTKQPLAI